MVWTHKPERTFSAYEAMLAEADIRREAFLLTCFARCLRRRSDPTIRNDQGSDFDVVEPNLSNGN